MIRDTIGKIEEKVRNSAAIKAENKTELLGLLAGRPPRLEFRPRVAGDAPHASADIGRARADLGYEPRTRLEDGLATQWAWHRALRAPAPGPGRRAA